MKQTLAITALLCMSLAGCGGDEKTNMPTDIKYAGTLAADIKGSADVQLTVHPDKTVDVSLKVQAKEVAGLVDGSATLTARGSFEPFPENDSGLYVAKFVQPASAGGPCGAEAVSLALSLHRRGKNNRVGGSLTAYCGKDKFYGVPVRILRLTGELPAQ